MGWLLWAGGCWGGQRHVFCETLLAATRTTILTVFTANKGASVFSLEFKLCPFQPLTLFPNLICTFRILLLSCEQWLKEKVRCRTQDVTSALDQVMTNGQFPVS